MQKLAGPEEMYKLAVRYVEASRSKAPWETFDPFECGLLLADVEKMAKWIQCVLWLMANAYLHNANTPADQELRALCQEAAERVL